ncbi:MAG: AraC family transcriptional regulator [Planctomycetota bacterium]|nr:AraC family transcriptional regulator [Planctomycetota bacterium]
MEAGAFLHLDPGRPVEALNAGLFISRGRSTHPDRTIDSHELIFVRKGWLKLAEEAREFEVRAGETLILRPGRRHRGSAPYPRDLRFYWIHFRVPHAPHAKSTKGAGRSVLALPQHAAAPRPDRLGELYHRFLDDQAGGMPRTPAADYLVMLMLCEVAAARTPDPAAPGTAAALAGRADSYIATRFHEPLAASDLAAALDCNPDYLGRVYRQVYGRTLTEAIQRRRVREAGALLREGLGNVDAIARECGFTESGYFRRIFRRLMGLTPRAYRRLHARAHINSR